MDKRTFVSGTIMLGYRSYFIHFTPPRAVLVNETQSCIVTMLLKHASDHYLGRYLFCFGMGITQKLKMACIQGDVYFLNFSGVTYCSNLVYSNEIKEINMSNTCHFNFVCYTHAEKYNAALNSDP